MTWATSVPILVIPGLSVLDLGPMYATDVRRSSSRNASTLRGRGIIIATKMVDIYSAVIMTEVIARVHDNHNIAKR